ncbi:trypsin-like peptidase domain-containing protein [Alkalibacter rhizosphaerae]|uniref:Trypsin-like peptidase domain-containing protein n=1 Tax=Alkalibacter rhizosphaerae TaxID=2815577 RepID=A0A974XGV0_9FIRM|nr:serine protease [Alkalibacter rhizosphaerae]QSX09568.1 trypsin-like peptidase domain-containing protein [Alkalibacter rhizosphaerae]
MKLTTIEEQLLFSTLRIESLDEKDEVVSIGTGFLIKREVHPQEYVVYLVSNKHVLFASDKIRLTFTQKDTSGQEPEIGKTMTFPISDIVKNLHIHSNPSVDIAVMSVTGLFISFPFLFFKAIGYEMLADFAEEELSVAQNVAFIGYPDNRFDQKNNLPLIRTGVISSHPKVNYNNEPIFIIDAQVFPGSSGSPLIINLSVEHWKTGNITIGGTPKIKLLGVVAATMIRNNKLQSLSTSKSSVLSTQEVIGLGIVYKSTALKEIIDAIPISSVR